MIDKYQPQSFEEKWRKIWGKERLYQFKFEEKKKKFYVLVELPYTSGDLHIGHWFAFTTPDVVARYKRMNGYNVFFPIGFDAFGLPAENAAIKRGVHPKDWTMKNIETMTKQFASMGSMINNWDKVVVTCLPQYYRWNQWIFLQMFKKGLIYQGEALSNWCPSCQTVLANENVVEGKCWRCDSQVEQKQVPQWFIKITAYAQRLIWPEKPVVDWPESVREGQNNWIGRSEGTEIKFEIRNPCLAGRQAKSEKSLKQYIKVFTTRADTLFGATAVVLAPEHWLISEILNSKSLPRRQAGEIRNPEGQQVDFRASKFQIPNSKLEEIKRYIEKAAKKQEEERLRETREKTGVDTGLKAVHPLTGEEIPVFVADYVLGWYGEGAVMLVPAHDERDFEFAKKFGLPAKKVVIPTDTFQSIVMKKSVEEGFYEKVKELNLEVVDYQNWGYKVTGSKNNLEYYIEIVQRNLKTGPWYVDIDGCVSLIIFKEKIFNLPKEYSNAKKYALEVLKIPKDQLDWQSEKHYHYCFPSKGILVNSGEFDALTSQEAIEKITQKLEKLGFGKKKVAYHLRDWSISRQRYWGTPVPIIYCRKCWEILNSKSENLNKQKLKKGVDYVILEGKEYVIHPVPEKDLPVELPYEVDFTPKGKPPLATNEGWLKVKCPKCGGQARRDAETLDTFFDSSWYWFRYVSPDYDQGPFDKKLVAKLTPVDIYFGGAEHTLGHTLYARFFTKFFHDLELVDYEEFALKRVQHGIVLGPDGNKMSKSKGNVVNPDEQVKEYGADAVRLYLCFMMPYEGTGPWSDETIAGVYRFLVRVWRIYQKFKVKSQKLKIEENKQLVAKLQKTIIKVTRDIERIKLNTAIAAMMEFVNAWEANTTASVGQAIGLSSEHAKQFLQLLAPFAPFLTEEIWREVFEEKTSIHLSKWPEAEKVEEEEVVIPVQVNGKLRGMIKTQISKLKSQDYIVELALKQEKVKKYVAGKKYRVIYVEGKVVNFVAK